MTANKRKIEVFSAGCPTCEETVEPIKRVACKSCDVTIHDMREKDVASRAKNSASAACPQSSLTVNWPIAA
jgi:glutaredoxin 3